MGYQGGTLQWVTAVLEMENGETLRVIDTILPNPNLSYTVRNSTGIDMTSCRNVRKLKIKTKKYPVVCCKSRWLNCSRIYTVLYQQRSPHCENLK